MKKIYELGLTKSPCKSHKVENLGPVSVVHMTCGGGMGGSSWREYGSFETEPEIGKMAKFVSAITGEEKTINPAYIVSIETKALVKVTSDTTPWRNYHRTECKKRIETMYLCFDESDTIKSALTHTSYDGELKGHVIGTFVDETPCK